MSQSRATSLIEAVTNVTVGFGLVLVVQAMLFQATGIKASLREQLGLYIAFTVLSLARSYVLRRVFTRLGR
ncbi:hypothetical protein MLD63_17425 [Paracoccus sp. TK19116]|uniref:Uncharacterized protein n=1 Tax=Paracoccus albicereus TaxID=2922394 RepID=A0ABT1MV46_9RHOB|nr:hypothetical protein [Paracoccus albicereus]MCQ0972203.1 hypothetical protein [Paracoccus albicereus]